MSGFRLPKTTIVSSGKILHLWITNNGTLCLFSSINPLSYLSLIICSISLFVWTFKKFTEIIEPRIIELSGIYRALSLWFERRAWDFLCVSLWFSLFVSKLQKPYEGRSCHQFNYGFWISNVTFCGQTTCSQRVLTSFSFRDTVKAVSEYAHIKSNQQIGL